MSYFVLQREMSSGFFPKSTSSALLHNFLPLLTAVRTFKECDLGTPRLVRSCCCSRFYLSCNQSEFALLLKNINRRPAVHCLQCLQLQQTFVYLGSHCLSFLNVSMFSLLCFGSTKIFYLSTKGSLKQAKLV